MARPRQFSKTLILLLRDFPEVVAQLRGWGLSQGLPIGDHQTGDAHNSLEVGHRSTDVSNSERSLECDDVAGLVEFEDRRTRFFALLVGFVVPGDTPLPARL